MTFGIAVTFPKSLEALDPHDRERVKAAVFDFQLAPDHPSRQLHRLDKCRDKNLWRCARSPTTRPRLPCSSANATSCTWRAHARGNGWW